MDRPQQSDPGRFRSQLRNGQSDGDGRATGARIVRTVMREEIKKIIVERILDGTYPPGSRVVESRIAREFGTSQAPVREALRDLEGMHLIETAPHKGARVRQQTRQRCLQAYPVRAVLEELAGRQASLKINDETIARLRVELDAMRRAAAQGDVKLHLRHDIRFHEAIIEASDNAVLLELWQALKVESDVFISAVKMDLNLPLITEMHEPILHALTARDAELSAKLMREHIMFFESVVRGAQGPSATTVPGIQL